MKKRKTAKNSRGFSKYLMSILLFLLFEAVAVTLWLTKDNLFYLLNFSYIGGCLHWERRCSLPGNAMPGILCSWRWEAICCCTLV